MSRLEGFAEDGTKLSETTDDSAIATALGEIGVTFERCATQPPPLG